MVVSSKHQRRMLFQRPLLGAWYEVWTRCAVADARVGLPWFSILFFSLVHCCILHVIHGMILAEIVHWISNSTARAAHSWEDRYFTKSFVQSPPLASRTYQARAITSCARFRSLGRDWNRLFTGAWAFLCQ